MYIKPSIDPNYKRYNSETGRLEVFVHDCRNVTDYVARYCVYCGEPLVKTKHWKAANDA